MKTSRQMMILEIIGKQSIGTQEELVRALRERGLQVTQATVSRDIKEMRLIKVMGPDGGYRYAVADRARVGANDRLIRMLSESVVNIACAGHMIVVKTLSGTANAAAEAMDNMNWPELLGTIAGDNTIFLVARSTEETDEVVRRIRDMIK